MDKYQIFDWDARKIKKVNRKYWVFLIMIIGMITILFLHEKNYYYQNNLQMIDNKNAIIVVEEDILALIKEKKALLINNISYDFKIVKIEKEDKVYLVKIKFLIELVNIKEQNYRILLKKESLLEYILRIMKGK